MFKFRQIFISFSFNIQIDFTPVSRQNNKFSIFTRACGVDDVRDLKTNRTEKNVATLVYIILWIL